MNVDKLTGCLREQRTRIREELLKGVSCPQPVER